MMEDQRKFIPGCSVMQEEQDVDMAGNCSFSPLNVILVIKILAG